MIASLRQRIQEMSHPRLATLVVTGLALVGLAGASTLVGFSDISNGSDIGFRLGVLGYLSIALGGTGYLALGIANRLPQP
jgi:hypothetical protein